MNIKERKKISWKPFRICLLNLSFLSFKVGKNRNDVYNLPFLSKQIFMDTPLECFMTVNHLVLLYSQTFTKINLHAFSTNEYMYIVHPFMKNQNLLFSKSNYSVAYQKNVN